MLLPSPSRIAHPTEKRLQYSTSFQHVVGAEQTNKRNKILIRIMESLLVLSAVAHDVA
jgi:hypothetical protein